MAILSQTHPMMSAAPSSTHQVMSSLAMLALAVLILATLTLADLTLTLT